MSSKQIWRNSVTEILGRTTNLPIQDFASYDFGRKQTPNCVSVIVPAQQVEKLLADIRAELPQGLVAFIGINWGMCWITARTEEREGFELVIGPGSTQFDILNLARPDFDNMDVIQRLQKYDHEFGIDIYHAEADSISFRFLHKPVDLNALAEDLLDYCPDLFAESEDPLHDLSTYLAKTERVRLWWD
jgi:hypothetical protein